MTIEATEVWMIFGSLIHQDFFHQYPDFLSGIEEIFLEMSFEQQEELYNIIKSVCQSNMSWKEKMAFWNSSGASYTFAGQNMDQMYCDILERLESVRNRKE